MQYCLRAVLSFDIIAKGQFTSMNMHLNMLLCEEKQLFVLQPAVLKRKLVQCGEADDQVQVISSGIIEQHIKAPTADANDFNQDYLYAKGYFCRAKRYLEKWWNSSTKLKIT